MRASLKLVVLAALGFFPAWAHAENFPSKPIQIVVPVVAGGATDIVTRTVGEALSRRIGQPVVIDNKGGGAGVPATMAVVTAKPDGYTLLAGYPGTLVVNPIVLDNPPYDPIKDLTPVSLITRYPMVLAVNSSIPVKTVAEFIAYAKARPGQLNYGSAGPGTTSHLAMELFKQEAGIDLVHVPFRGAAPAMAELLAGRLAATVDSVTLVVPQVEAGKLRALGITSAKPSALIPGVLPIAETGPKNFDVSGWIALMAPARTPPEVVQYLSKELAHVLNDPETKKRVFDRGMEGFSSTPEELRALIDTEMKTWRSLVERAQLKF